jgi:5'-nucleotidase
MRILVTNDDGVESPGLHALREIALGLAGPDGEVWVSAPETNHSGAGHSLSLNEPVRIRKLDEHVFAVRGTPTDSVIMGVHHVLKGRKVDLILSGINRGGNLAEDVTYSGTIAACFEGTLLGIRSIAMSQQISLETKHSPRWQTPLAHAPGIVKKLLQLEWAPGTLYSLNFPDREPDEVKGVSVAVQGRRDAGLLSVEERHDTWNNPYYWLAYKRSQSKPPPGTDLWAIAEGRICVTPLSMNLTNTAGLEAARAAVARE